MDDFSELDFSEMVLRLAHEIRNPLATIQSGIQLVEHLSKPEGEIREYLDGVLLEVARLDQIVRAMQELARIAPQAPERIDIGQAVAIEIAGLSDLAARATVELVVEERPAASVAISSDHFGLAIRELLTNAIRVSPHGGQVLVDWVRDSDHWALFFDDQGTGVPIEREERIFRPFFSTFTRGTGLGLNKVARICRIYGGSIQWENRECGGCRFVLRLRSA